MVEQRFDKIKFITIILFLLAVVILITAAGVFLFGNSNFSDNFVSKQTFLASIYNSKEAYEDIFASLKKSENFVNAKAGIISHHFLAKQSIADFYNEIGNDKTKIVFLVSPDHFNNYFSKNTLAYSGDLNWQTPFGDLETNKNIINNLLNNSTEINNPALGLDHGIYVEIPFIKKFFPNAKVIPLILKNSSNFDNFENLGKELRNLQSENSILIISSDFSHNVSVAEAKINDTKSIRALDNLNKNNIRNIESDCKQCIAVLTGFLQNNENNFYLTGNKNSFEISLQDENSVTSYVFGYFSEEKNIEILFTGDLMFDRGIRYFAEKNGGLPAQAGNNFIFEKIKDFLLNKNLVVANLEGPITDNKSKSAGTAPGSANNYIFTFDKSVAKTLFDQNIKLVNLGNNHILNFGKTGLEQTKNYLEKAGVNYFRENFFVQEISGIKIAFVSYNQFAENDLEEILEKIKKLKLQADLVFVFSHWGDEYQLTESENQKNLAHKFIDAGADLIIGSHPHVIQPLEIYKNKRIYYSLGNFIFDQYFDENVRNGLGIIVKINKNTENLSFSEQGFYLENNGQTRLR